MITTSAKVRTDNDLVCIRSHTPLVQPKDMDPCSDPWWCGECEQYVIPFLAGKYALCTAVGTDVKRVCTGELVAA